MMNFKNFSLKRLVQYAVVFWLLAIFARLSPYGISGPLKEDEIASIIAMIIMLIIAYFYRHKWLPKIKW